MKTDLNGCRHDRHRRRAVETIAFAACLGLFTPDTLLPGLGAKAVAGPESSDHPVLSLAEEYWDAYMEHYPLLASELGDHRFSDRLPDLGPKAREEWKADLNAFLKRTRAIRPHLLTRPEHNLTRRLLERHIRDEMTRLAVGTHYLPLDPLGGFHLKLPLARLSQPLKTAEDFQNYIDRLKAFPVLTGQIIQNMREGQKLGFITPRVLVERVRPQLRQQVVYDATRSELYKAADMLANLPDAQRPSLDAQLKQAISEYVVPAYMAWLAFVEDDVLHRARTTIGASDLPGGKRLYQAMADIHTTVRMPVDEIHDVGLQEVARIKREMDGIRKEIGFTGSVDQFIRHMRTDPDQRFGSAEEIVSEAEQLLNRAKRNMPKLFGRLPRADCVMMEIEEFRAPSSPSAYYGPVPADGSRPGWFYINTYQPEERLRFTLEALTYHESVPGHHLQIALDVENRALPRFRRYYGNSTAYVEGWALYAEKLGYEMGGYETPASRFGQLTFEMWRAARLVVDTGIHAKKWSRKRAVDYMAANTSLSMLDINAEIDRYITWPGQALAYKIGERRILEIRRTAEQRLGESFDLKAFHDALLAEGPMPVDMLESLMQAWNGH